MQFCFFKRSFISIIGGLLIIGCPINALPYGKLNQRYEYFCNIPSDINEHLPILKKLATECSTVTEIGLRDMVSTAALLQGLSENVSPARSYLGIDIVSPPITTLYLNKALAKSNHIQFVFWQENDMNVDIPITELLFIDSLHTYCHLSYELEKFSPYVTKYIAMHDTSDPWGGLDDSEYRGDYSEYPQSFDRQKRGLWIAVEDFLVRHPEWMLCERRLNNHGFTVLKRR